MRSCGGRQERIGCGHGLRRLGRAGTRRGVKRREGPSGHHGLLTGLWVRPARQAARLRGYARRTRRQRGGTRRQRGGTRRHRGGTEGCRWRAKRRRWRGLLPRRRISIRRSPARDQRIGRHGLPRRRIWDRRHIGNKGCWGRLAIGYGRHIRRRRAGLSEGAGRHASPRSSVRPQGSPQLTRPRRWRQRPWWERAPCVPGAGSCQ